MFPKIGVPQNGWFILEDPSKMDDLGGKPTTFGNIQMFQKKRIKGHRKSRAGIFGANPSLGSSISNAQEVLGGPPLGLWWYPQIIHFNGVFHYKPSILGYPYFWKHPYIRNEHTR